MVREVNATTVDPSEKLTDNVYHYDVKDKIFELGGKFVERQAAKEKASVKEAGEKKRVKRSLFLENLKQQKPTRSPLFFEINCLFRQNEKSS